MRKRLLLKESLIANIFIFAVLIVIIQVTINLHMFDPFHRSFADFKFTDLIYSKFSKRSLDTNIVIVNIGKLDRKGIAELVKKVNSQNPAVVGLDILFSELKDPVGDLALKQAFAETKNLVLAAGLKGDNHHEHATLQLTNPFFGNFPAGTATLIANEGNTIRYFQAISEHENEKYYSFASQIVKFYDQEAFNNLDKRQKKKEKIRYRGNYDKFITLDNDDVLNGDASIMEGRIVLIGYLNEKVGMTDDLEDMYFTPVNPAISGKANPDMKGVVIHANIVSMILEGNYISELPWWLNWLIAFLLCYVHLILFLYYYVENHKWFHPVAKVVQLLTSILLIWIVFLFYQYFRIDADIKLAIAAILLSVDLLYFYDGFIKFIAKKTNYKSYLVEFHH